MRYYIIGCRALHTYSTHIFDIMHHGHIQILLFLNSVGMVHESACIWLSCSGSTHFHFLVCGLTDVPVLHYGAYPGLAFFDCFRLLSVVNLYSVFFVLRSGPSLSSVVVLCLVVAFVPVHCCGLPCLRLFCFYCHPCTNISAFVRGQQKVNPCTYYMRSRWNWILGITIALAVMKNLVAVLSMETVIVTVTVTVYCLRLAKSQTSGACVPWHVCYVYLLRSLNLWSPILNFHWSWHLWSSILNLTNRPIIHSSNYPSSLGHYVQPKVGQATRTKHVWEDLACGTGEATNDQLTNLLYAYTVLISYAYTLAVSYQSFHYRIIQMSINHFHTI